MDRVVLFDQYSVAANMHSADRLQAQLAAPSGRPSSDGWAGIVVILERGVQEYVIPGG
jgi:hypothetical protein